MRSGGSLVTTRRHFPTRRPGGVGMSITAISPYIAALRLRPPWRSQPNMEGLMPELVCLSDLSRQHHTLFDMEQDLMAIRNLADGIILIASDGEDDDPATNSNSRDRLRYSVQGGCPVCSTPKGTALDARGAARERSNPEPRPDAAAKGGRGKLGRACELEKDRAAPYFRELTPPSYGGTR